MDFTGERFVPECDGRIEAEHYHRYFLAQRLVGGKTVLDIACGEGYGSSILAGSAKHVTGVDISSEAVRHAKKRYARASLDFLEGSATAIPVPDNVFDVATSFETIEHLSDHGKMLDELKRVLKEDGLLVISTPNKDIYSEDIHNEFHVKELSRDDFLALLESRFKNIFLLGQICLYGSIINGTDSQSDIMDWCYGSENVAVRSLPEFGMYYIALASDAPLPHIPSTIFKYPEPRCNSALQLKREKMIVDDVLDMTASRLEDELSVGNELRHELNRVNLERAELLKKYDIMVNSRSWKITSPVRKTFGVARQVTDKLRRGLKRFLPGVETVRRQP